MLLNKPVGYLSSRRSQGGKPTVYDLLPTKYQNLKTAGRLDVDSSGLMLLSSDGDLIQRLTHPKFQKTKVYEIVLDRSLQPLHQQMISDFGIDLPDGKSKLLLEKIEKSPNIFSTLSPALRTNGADRTTGSPPESGLPDPGMGMSPGSDRLGHTAKVEKIFGDFSDQHWRVTMHEGRNRQIRRTFAALGYNIKQLHRTQLGPYRLGDLKTGKFREITVKLK
ncbi:MAG: pseudouridine synthase [Candidatus Nomurabacteria bacterium]|nr:pseudouridine synthase [Candidatus Nomurabacteria bacterium]